MIEQKKLRDSLNLYNDYKSTFIKNEKNISLSVKLDMLSEQYDLLLSAFDFTYLSPNPLDTELWITRENKSFMLPKIEAIMSNKRASEREFGRAYKLWDRVMALTARRSFHHFLIYMELDRSETRRVYHNKRDVILKPFAYYFNEMIFTKGFNFLSDSKPPSSGKSFCVNYASAWVYGLDKDSSVLRISVAEDNVYTASNNIKNIIQEERFANIFPYFAKLKNRNQKPFEIEKINGWKITGADVEASHLAVPMGGQIEGKRANRLIIVDDSLKMDDAHNEDLMEANWNKWQSSISARADGNDVKNLMIGTMWHPNDLLGRMIVYESQGRTVKPGKFKYTKELWEDNKLVGVIIQTPMLDYETEESTCEYVLTTANATKKRDDMDEFLWQSAYQQQPIPPKGRLFEYASLKQYDSYSIDKIEYRGNVYKLGEYARMAIDPVRKGTDNIACPIFKHDEDEEYEFLIDVIFKGKAMDEIYGEIIKKIVLHNITYIVLENNTDTSLKELLLEKLKNFNRSNKTNYVVEIKEIYNVTRKKTRISNENFLILQKIVFPERSIYPTNSEMGQFMNNVTRYSDLLPNKHDDAPDSLALYANDVIRDKREQKATAEALSVNILYGY